MFSKFAACGDVRRRGGRTSSQALAHSPGECQGKTSTRTSRVPDPGSLPDGWQTPPVDLDAFRWLLTEPGQRLLEQADEVVAGGADDLRAQSALRRTASSEHVAAALTQVGL